MYDQHEIFSYELLLNLIIVTNAQQSLNKCITIVLNTCDTLTFSYRPSVLTIFTDSNIVAITRINFIIVYSINA